MGLDVYLYRYVNRKETEEREKKYQEFSNKIWGEAGDYDSLSSKKKIKSNLSVRSTPNHLVWMSGVMTNSPNSRLKKIQLCTLNICSKLGISEVHITVEVSTEY